MDTTQRKPTGQLKSQANALPANDRPATMKAFLAEQNRPDLLRCIIFGSVDDGKSTLIGRLPWEADPQFGDQLASLPNDSRQHGTQGQTMDFAPLADGLATEREQGMRLDVAYRFFATSKRQFIVADTPDHEQCTRNMVTGAYTADAAILLVDPRAGLLAQTRRHAYLASRVGIQNVVLAINKMDRVNFDQRVFQDLGDAFAAFAAPLGFESVTPIPISALMGDNMTTRSSNTPWYAGPTLMACLETLPTGQRRHSERLVFPVQGVKQPNARFKGFSGTVSQGVVKPGDTIRVTASGQTAQVTEIVTPDGLMERAQAGQAITLRLDREIDASHGDIMSPADQPLETSDQFEATVVWIHSDAGLPGRRYDIKLSTQRAFASITHIQHRIDINTLAPQAAQMLQLHDIAVCNMATSQPLVCDSYASSKELGSFILVDRFTHATLAVGMISHSLRRAQNVHQQALTVSRANRERLNGHKGKVVWFTGLSGSGKSTLANALEAELHAQGMRTYLLDGDNVRQGLNKDLGFTDADRVENIRRIAEVAKLMMDAGLIVMTAFISPFRQEREMARELIGSDNFIEVYVNTTLEVCEQRDVKGLYKKARTGSIPHMTGINSPYEAPENPLFIATGEHLSPRENISGLVKLIIQP